MPKFTWKHFISFALIGIASSLIAAFYTASVIGFWVGGVPEGAITIQTTEEHWVREWISATSGWFAGIAAIGAAVIAYASGMKQVRKLEDQISEAQKANHINQIEHIANVMEFCAHELYLIQEAINWITEAKRCLGNENEYRRLISNYNAICEGFVQHNSNAAKYSPNNSYQDRQKFLQKMEILWSFHLDLISEYEGAPIPLTDFAIDTFKTIQKESARCISREIEDDPFSCELLDLENILFNYSDSIPDNWMEQLHSWREGVVTAFMKGSSN
ncbi:hypothetical protein ACMG4P_07420 [Pseudovibrio denitrificans]|uniref:hypothetical protein n=1 Tax=Pseudovibrio denitrificans TaxID=258256 RepID=UPI0039BF129F